MDPTAPNDNKQNPEGSQNVQNNPVQPGQFVVSGEPGETPAELGVNPQPTGIGSQPPFDNSRQPSSQSPSGSIEPQQAGDSQPFGQNIPVENPQFAAAQSPPQTNVQPDPTPFNAQNIHPGPQVPDPQVSSNGGSKMAKFKILAVIIAILLLLAIIAIVIWFFVFNKKSDEEVNVTQPLNQIEEPATPSPETGNGFGDLPQATQEATPPAQEQPIITP
ncbi:hypothetical protein A3A49_00805 [Candidatus Curtissbacteria bacterium RIFCSPLOWO2_01_FULL_38_11b]|uniref:Uncharacterized protein n=1 Tax=Candidatus Curtissbacteria bacterium RIFCSPLOWO2_01_FULL_38_11b TaxID=1797725 RepID=A0A1F5GZ47_9BACT|nr:MAG: hypothetical protein A3A49_00805 [Candidatus Curtissbacteria bacterium RIFCSPLOWO2_01_FULL_38_11b]